jgi:hypothetical protein
MPHRLDGKTGPLRKRRWWATVERATVASPKQDAGDSLYGDGDSKDDGDSLYGDGDSKGPPRQQRTTATAKDYSDSKGLQRRADGAGQAAAVA